MLGIVALILGSAAIIATLLSLLRAKAWWIRIWDFPASAAGSARVDRVASAYDLLPAAEHLRHAAVFALELHEPKVEFLVQPGKPSMQAKVVLRDGQPVWLDCVHPPPAVPGETDESTERDSALLLVGRRVSEATGPVVVCGDLNDVAWSRTTRLFQKISGLLEPRKGRGFFSNLSRPLSGLSGRSIMYSTRITSGWLR